MNQHHKLTANEEKIEINFPAMDRRLIDCRIFVMEDFVVAISNITPSHTISFMDQRDVHVIFGNFCYFSHSAAG
jgi:hypothetical protein